MDGAQVAPPANAPRHASGNTLVRWMRSAAGFLVAVREELKRVTWPTRPELIKATRMIVVLSILLGITIGLMDWLLQVILVDGVARLAR